MSARWLLARHGATEWSAVGRYAGHADVPLSDLGREQARRLAARLADERIAVCYTSDRQRATQTLDAVLSGPCVRAGTQPVVIICPELRELDFGAWEGRTYAQIASEPDGPAVLGGQAAPPGGESLRDLAARVGRFLARARPGMDDAGERTAVIIAHGGSLRALLCSALGLPVAEHWRFQVDAGSVSELAWEADTGARLVSLNDRCHLKGAASP